jgi:hypothetical protein
VHEDDFLELFCEWHSWTGGRFSLPHFFTSRGACRGGCDSKFFTACLAHAGCVWLGTAWLLFRRDFLREAMEWIRLQIDRHRDKWRETGGAEETEERIVIDLTTIQKERGATPTLENKKCKGKSLGEAEYLIQRAAGEEPFWSEWDSRREKTWYAWKLRLEQRHWAFGPGFHPVCCYLTPL